MGCCKYLMFFFNLLIFLGGVALLAVGIWVVVGGDSFKDIISNDPTIFNAVYVIIAVGCFLIIIGFLGCCGAIKENRCMLGTFFALVLVVFILEIIGGVLAFVFYPNARQEAVDSMRLFNNPSAEGQTVTAGWQALQDTFDCCGVNGILDWTTAGVVVPPAPCLSIPPKQGCEAAIQHYFWVLGAISLAVLVIEILAMIFACCLYQNVNKERLA